MAFLELPLMRQERRALHEEHRKGRHSDVSHAVGRVDTTALVRNRSKLPRNDPSRESSGRMHARNPILRSLRIRFLA